MRGWLVAILVPLLVLVVRLQIDERRELAVGDVASLGRAARLGSSDARTRLAELGRKGDLAAYEELRGSILATRWLRTPDPALLDEANTAIARSRGVDVSLLRATHEPSRAFSVLALLGFTFFLFGVARALGGAPKLAFIGATGFVLFCVGLAFA